MVHNTHHRSFSYGRLQWPHRPVANHDRIKQSYYLKKLLNPHIRQGFEAERECLCFCNRIVRNFSVMHAGVRRKENGHQMPHTNTWSTLVLKINNQSTGKKYDKKTKTVHRKIKHLMRHNSTWCAKKQVFSLGLSGYTSIIQRDAAMSVYQWTLALWLRCK